MRRFAQLFDEIDQTTRLSEKQAAIERYFREAPPRDAAWALFFLTGRRLMKATSHALLREWAAAAAGIPLWLLDASYELVGDLSESLSLVLPDTPENTRGTSQSLADFVEQRLLPMATLKDADPREITLRAWRELNARQRFIFHKLVSGNFRVGAAKRLVVRGLAAVSGIDPAVMEHRLLGRWEPTAAGFLALWCKERHETDLARPYPFFLASPIENLAAGGRAQPAENFADGDSQAAAAKLPVIGLGDPREWQVEWKWDGIRAQLIRRGGQAIIWSRGEAIVTHQFPEIAGVGAALPDGTVLDGEILAWEGDTALPFAFL